MYLVGIYTFLGCRAKSNVYCVLGVFHLLAPRKKMGIVLYKCIELHFVVFAGEFLGSCSVLSSYRALIFGRTREAADEIASNGSVS